MTIEIKGLDGIVAKLNETIDEEKINHAIGKACAFVEGEAKNNIKHSPTGTLKDSITFEVNGLEGKVFTPLEYAPYVEFGTGLFAIKGGRQDAWTFKDDEGHWWTTKGQKPQPFLYPALENNIDTIKALIAKEVFNK